MTIYSTTSTSQQARARGAGVTAVLGPTNTGKTHLAIERMLGHSSGMIGLPLRLAGARGLQQDRRPGRRRPVALITGEEKIKPPNAALLGRDRRSDAARSRCRFSRHRRNPARRRSRSRPRVHRPPAAIRRGREETLILGAATMRPMVDKLLPGANMLSRPRLSQLTFAGEKKITRLPRRSAIVAFSAEEVYAIAELIRRQRGGAAVVLGALSPRTRNAQVALYQSGDVDYLVATDAIGMGLNLDVDHVAFASDRKFDGYQFRKLNPVEFAQIAGRAGRAHARRHVRHHRTLPAVRRRSGARARKPRVRFREGVAMAQLRSRFLLARRAGRRRLPPCRANRADARADRRRCACARTCRARRGYSRPRARPRRRSNGFGKSVRFPTIARCRRRRTRNSSTTLYGFLSREGKIPDDWYSSQITQADRTDGGIDTLSARIAHIRTWTFVANRPDWLKDPEHWQGVARAVEDRLSDALHERLAERFVDRRTSVLMRRLKENTMLETEISKTGDVVVEGHTIGRLEGFRFTPDASAGGSKPRC